MPFPLAGLARHKWPGSCASSRGLPGSVWSCLCDSNARPADYKSAALPAELRQHIKVCGGRLVGFPPLCRKYIPLKLEYLLVPGRMLIAAGDHALIFPARPGGRGDRRDNAAKGGQHDIQIHKQPTFLQNKIRPAAQRTDALCQTCLAISRLPGGSACSPPRVKSGHMRWRLADPHADPPGIKRPRQHGRLSGQDRRLKTLSQAIFDYNAIIVGSAETMLKFSGPLLHSGAFGINSVFRTPCGPLLLPRKSR